MSKEKNTSSKGSLKPLDNKRIAHVEPTRSEPKPKEKEKRQSQASSAKD